MFGFTACKDEDENNNLDGYSISFTNDGSLKDSDGNAIEYSRQWNVTHTNHLSADATITIDRTTKSTKVGSTSNSSNGNVTTTDGGNNAAYIYLVLQVLEQQTNLTASISQASAFTEQLHSILFLTTQEFSQHTVTQMQTTLT